jgi:predicted DNA-binding transcriptional regulator AlpA
MQLTIPTTDEIRVAVRDELATFFSLYQLQPTTEADEIGGVELAMEITGKAKPTIYSLCSERKIPHSKRGKQLYFSRRELLDWIQAGKRKTASEIQSDANLRRN